MNRTKSEEFTYVSRVIGYSLFVDPTCRYLTIKVIMTGRGFKQDIVTLLSVKKDENFYCNKDKRKEIIYRRPDFKTRVAYNFFWLHVESHGIL